MLEESSAAALAQRELNKSNDIKKRLLLVFDFGGGTLDVTILEVRGDTYIIRAIDGDVNLGGQDIDHALV